MPGGLHVFAAFFALPPASRTRDRAADKYLVGMSDDFDLSTGPELLGTHVLVGITRIDRAGRVVEQSQFHGTVVRATVADGVVIVNAAGKELTLPPDSRAFEPAEPGEYSLRSSDEVVVDPDYLSRWVIRPPDRH